MTDDIFSLELSAPTETELLKTNETAARFGLTLSGKGAKELLEVRKRSLQENGRIEWGESIVKELICTFCDSPYLHQSTYVEMLSELTEIFYYAKNETSLSDDELLCRMKKRFDGFCGGSSELLKDSITLSDEELLLRQEDSRESEDD